MTVSDAQNVVNPDGTDGPRAISKSIIGIIGHAFPTIDLSSSSLVSQSLLLVWLPIVHYLPVSSSE